MSIIEDLLALIAPHQCIGCGREGSLLCATCSADLRKVPPRCYVCRRWSDDFKTCVPCRRQTPLRNVWAVTTYDGVAKELLHRFKFERARAGAKPIAALLAVKYASVEDVVVVHVPTANTRVRQRGYDQAALIAKEFAARIERPHLPLLIRVGNQRQVGRHRQERKQQMTEAFRLTQGNMVPPKHVLLIDDVLTTGATCEAAARVLRQAGVARVSAAVFAVA